jgi:ketosteroid isomerase-like protein
LLTQEIEERNVARESGRTPPEAEIRALINDWARAVRAKDVDAIVRRAA